MRFFSGAGGMMRPKRRYLLTRRSCKPKKSLNLRIELNCLALNFGMLVCVDTLFLLRWSEKNIGKVKSMQINKSNAHFSFNKNEWIVVKMRVLTCMLSMNPCLRRFSVVQTRWFRWRNRNVHPLKCLPLYWCWLHSKKIKERGCKN